MEAVLDIGREKEREREGERERYRERESERERESDGADTQIGAHETHEHHDC